MDYKELFLKNSVEKQVIMKSDDGLINITNEELDGETMELTESICAEDELTFGTCSAAQIKFTVSNVFIPMKGKWLNVDIKLKTDGTPDKAYRLGRYKVYSDKPTADRTDREIIAYDALYDVLNCDVAEWYNKILPDNDSSVSIRVFRDSFFSAVGIEQEEVTLINDCMQVKRTISPDELSGAVVLNCICEINGCFGHIGRNGKFKYIYLEQDIRALYPRNDLYPRDDIYPIEPKGVAIHSEDYISAEYEDYIVTGIDKLQIRQQENDIGAIVGDGSNAYVIEDNFLVYGKDGNELETIASNILEVIKNIIYRPFAAECVGNPCVEVGSAIRIGTRYEIIESYVFERTLKGIQSLTDSISANGEQFRSTQVNGKNRSIIQLKGKMNELIRTVDKTIEHITDVENDLSLKITHTAEDITEEISKKYSTKNEAQDYANTAKDSADKNTDSKLKNYYTVTQADTKIEKTANGIKQTVAKTQTKWDVTGLPSDTVYGYGAPVGISEDKKYYFDADSGWLYVRSTEGWKQAKMLSSIQDWVHSEINQSTDSIKMQIQAGEKTWDVSGYWHDINYKGYGEPDEKNYPINVYRGKTYLDVNTGRVYYCANDDGSYEHWFWDQEYVCPIKELINESLIDQTAKKITTAVTEKAQSLATDMESKIEQTADRIKQTVAAAQTKWDVSDYWHDINYSGYGTPGEAGYLDINRYRGSTYLDVNTGRVYYCCTDDGTYNDWFREEYQAKTASERYETRFEQTATAISSRVEKDKIVSTINQSAEKVKIKADKITLDGAVAANVSLTTPELETGIINGGTINGATINGGTINGAAVSFGENRVVINEEGMWVLGNGGVENPDFKVDQQGFVHLGNNLKMSSAGIWWTDNTGVERFKSWSDFFS